MPVKVERLPDLPVLICTYEGVITFEAVEAVIMETAKFMTEVEGKVYRISVGQSAEITLSLIYPAIKNGMRNVVGAINDENVYDVAVGNSHSVRLALSFLASLGVKMLVFATLEEAIAHMQRRIKDERENNGDPAKHHPNAPQ